MMERTLNINILRHKLAKDARLPKIPVTQLVDEAFSFRNTDKNIRLTTVHAYNKEPFNKRKSKVFPASLIILILKFT